MTTHLDDVFDPALLEQMLTQKMVKVQRHPDTDLFVYNYTQFAQFERVWNPVTLACRGLIVDAGRRVVARPFRKFFNVSEHASDALPGGAVHVTDKLDGSLGVLYQYGNGHAIATRGSFTSEQACHATKLWQERYARVFAPNPAWTYLFEIVYPDNRIVVDYHGLDDLILLGAVDIASGRSISLTDAASGWTGPVAEEFPFTTLEEALAAPARGNCEGIVVHFTDSDLRVKVKHDEYVRLHRLVTGVSERRVWEALSQGQDLAPWLEAVPDEFHTFVSSTRDRLAGDFAHLTLEAARRYDNLVASLPDGWGRKDFAAGVAEMDWPLARTMFLLLDGRGIDHAVWGALRPEEHVPLFTRNEDSD